MTTHAYPHTTPAPRPAPATPANPTPFPSPSTSAGNTAVARPGRGRRAAVVLIAGVAVLALAVAGLTYALLNRGDGADGRTGGASSSARTGDDNNGTGQTGGPAPTASEHRSEEGEGDGEESPPPQQSVRVTVKGTHTEYSGSCPPPKEQSPSFTATFTVERLPAEVSYRWMGENDSVTDPGWRTLSFPEGGGRTKQDTVIVTTYLESGTFENSIGVEVREPVRTTSDSVPFSVTCEEETPPDGVSSSPAGSAAAP